MVDIYRHWVKIKGREKISLAIETKAMVEVKIRQHRTKGKLVKMGRKG